jgi:hypothetical protein
MDQLLGEQHPPRLGDRDWRGADMLAEQAPQLARADTEPVGEALDVRFIETTGFDQGQCTRYRIGGAAPEGEIR